MLWRFHELHHSQEDMSVLTVFRTHPLIHVSYLVALLPVVVLLANGMMSTTILVLYGALGRARALEHPARLRPAPPGVREPELPPDPPPPRRAPRRQPRLRAEHLGPTRRPGGVPERIHHPRRHRVARPPAPRRAGGRPAAAPRCPRPPIGGTLPSCRRQLHANPRGDLAMTTTRSQARTALLLAVFSPNTAPCPRTSH